MVQIVEHRLSDIREQARDVLAASDRTVLRCYETGDPVPEAWVFYRAALREVVRTGDGPLPARPDWP